MKLFILCFFVGAVSACTDSRPTDNSQSVLIGLYNNPNGGVFGEDCDPTVCEPENIKMEQYYKISGESDQCYAWKGNAGENSAQPGECNLDDSSYTFQQWTTCDCTGSNTNVKHAYVGRCVVENPTTLCSKILDYSACDGSVSTYSSSSESGSDKEGTKEDDSSSNPFGDSTTDAPTDTPSVTMSGKGSSGGKGSTSSTSSTSSVMTNNFRVAGGSSDDAVDIELPTNGPTDGPSDGPTDGPSDGPTDGPKATLPRGFPASGTRLTGQWARFAGPMGYSTPYTATPYGYGSSAFGYGYGSTFAAPIAAPVATAAATTTTVDAPAPLYSPRAVTTTPRYGYNAPVSSYGSYGSYGGFGGYGGLGGYRGGFGGYWGR